MLQVPALVTGVLFRRSADATFAFSQDAPYLFAEDAEQAWYDRGRRTVECTKRGMGVQLYAALAVLGEALLVETLEQLAGRARALAARVTAAPDFELLTEPECNIVCFRHVPAGVVDLDTHNRQLRARMLRAGEFYFVETLLPQGLFLRATLMNPRTEKQELDDLLVAVRAAAR